MKIRKFSLGDVHYKKDKVFMGISQKWFLGTCHALGMCQKLWLKMIKMVNKITEGFCEKFLGQNFTEKTF